MTKIRFSATPNASPNLDDTLEDGHAFDHQRFDDD